MTTPYNMEPISKNFGRFVRGIDLSKDIPSKIIDQIKKDLIEHRVLIFKNQGKLSAETQIKISNWWGKIHSTFYQHPRSPHPDIFRVSNDATEGCIGVGRTGWHIDGTFTERPFKVQTMHFWAVCEGGKTRFSPMKEMIEGLTKAEREDWEQLWFVARGSNIVHPLIYPHPDTKEPVMIIHTGRPFFRRFAKNFDSESRRAESLLTPQETSDVIDGISKRLEVNAVDYEWELGDFAVIDNLAMAHFASEGTQGRRKKVGLRILHRTTVAGTNKPRKEKKKARKEEKLDIG